MAPSDTDNLRNRHLGSTMRVGSQQIRWELGCYIAGFTDGEGCFFIGTSGCQFIIKLRADDRALLELIQKAFGGIGTIRDATTTQGNRQAQIAFIVARHKELVWLTEFFDTFRLLGKKRHDYAIWREAVIEHANGMPPAQLATYKAELR